MPLLKVNCHLTPKTLLRAAAEGVPGLAYSVTDLANDRESFEQRTYTVYFTNLSEYFGYDISTSVGLIFDRKHFTDPFRSSEDFSTTAVFFRVILGYSLGY